ncbi:hypothetical protein L596_020182 [Steinernema carpocapsae]|uniref:F-box domain-containing protein n=1 Tax=Steinernema carpocapsae TaxID=34508 RepID=A0A4U5MSU3_STECR|nr:hypothetical protein L596_020182 [Steinernema carpocapsae]
MEELPFEIIDLILDFLPNSRLRSLNAELPESNWMRLCGHALVVRTRLRISIFLPCQGRDSLHYKIEYEIKAQMGSTWHQLKLEKFLKYPENYIIETLNIVGQSPAREFKRKNHFPVDLTDGLPDPIQILLHRRFAPGPHTSVKLSMLNSTHPHLAMIVEHIRPEFQIFSLENVLGHADVVESILQRSIKDPYLRKLMINGADCGSNFSKLSQELVFQPQFRELNVNSDSIDFQLKFFQAVFKNWQNLESCGGRVQISVPSTINERETGIKPSKRSRQKRKNAHFQICTLESYRFGFRQQLVKISYT